MNSNVILRVAALRPLLLFGTVAMVGVNMTSSASASAFYLQEQSVRGWGRANSGETADQGPASLWWNPASIGGTTGTSLSFGATAFFPIGRVRDLGTLIDRPVVAAVPVGGASAVTDPVQRGVAPNFALAIPVGDRIALGLSVSSPFSFTTDYDSGGWQRYSAIRTRLLTADIQSSVAFAPTPWLSLGGALNVEYADALLSNALPNLAAGLPDARLKLTGNGWDLGWSAGVQLRPSERLAFGIGYKSAITHRLDGRVAISGLLGPLAARNVDTDTTARFTTPWQLSIGARGAISDRLTLNAQTVRYGWSRFDTIQLGAPLGNAVPEHYKDVWSFAVGVDAKASERLTVRAGIQLDPTPTRNTSRDARVPDGDRMDYNIGLSYRAGRSLTLDGAFGYTDFRNSAISRDEHFYAGTAAQTDVFTDGRAAGQRALVLSIGGRFEI
ncbi:MAG: aromatic hydrocarbon degradation protein [Alphaproteobacteria bacterium]|nr:aromatic hydrocarbon degradation protein [Alphaproteobacteria bacterium]